MDRKVRTLARPINRKIAQRDDPHFVEMRESRTEKFASNFRRRVWAERLTEMFCLGKWDLLRRAVNRRARCEDESLNSARARGFEQIQRAGDIRLVIKPRLFNRWSNTGAGGEMENRAEPSLSQQL